MTHLCPGTSITESFLLIRLFQNIFRLGVLGKISFFQN
ncbi:Uncharacterized protein dnl_19130 [Desulfonema limicola]|uniref:Uncharacterized protein n=1 Tax=Desulfonema limicola TaxID=45656 RepID=A0A975B6F1_9BACT|nr:Uncharacterized protein dnl_19130 [Desulfonema limicola]